MNKYIYAFILVLFFQLNASSQKKEITIVSWNIADFGKEKSTNEIEKIATILKDYDIIAIQEVVAGYGGAQAVARLSEELNRKGTKWSYVVSNPTNSPKYLLERYAFIWKNKHIKIKNRGALLSDLATVIDREPFVIDFYFNKKKFTIINYHARNFKKRPEDEIQPLLAYIAKNIKTPVILAADFNKKSNDSIFESFKKQGFIQALKNKRTTLKRKCVKDNYLNYPIDNIFYSKHFTIIKAKPIDFVKYCDNLTNARMLSDHLPVLIRVKI